VKQGTTTLMVSRTTAGGAKLSARARPMLGPAPDELTEPTECSGGKGATGATSGAKYSDRFDSRGR
jgi:hypothetical protein